MRKRISFLLVAVLLLATLIPALPIFAADETTGGETDTGNTFDADDANPKISTAADYRAFFEYVFVKKNDLNGKTVTLLNDITFNDTTNPDWYKQETAVKLNYTASDWLWFRGTFDGGNHTLKGVIVEGSIRDGQLGLFPVAINATIKNLNVDGFYVCGTNTSNDPLFARAGIGGLVGCAKENLTIDHVTMKNGIVTAAENAKGALSAFIGVYATENVGATALSITNCTVEDSVEVLKGTSSCSYTGGLIGYVETNGTAKASKINLSETKIQPKESVGENATLKAFGKFRYKGGNPTIDYQKWSLIGADCERILPMQSQGVSLITETFPSASITFADYTDRWNQAILDVGSYGDCKGVIKFVGTQPAIDGSNDIRFVGMIERIDDLERITTLGFEITVGDKTVGTDRIKCTKLYESIKENGVDKPAPEGYYYFTFVVTDVADGTAFTVKACTTMDETDYTTSAGIYTYSPTASSES